MWILLGFTLKRGVACIPALNASFNDSLRRRMRHRSRGKQSCYKPISYYTILIETHIAGTTLDRDRMYNVLEYSRLVVSLCRQ